MSDTVSILHASLIAGFSGLQGVAHCSATPLRRDGVKLPAIFIELAELEPEVDPGTGELQLKSHWEARVVISEHVVESMLWMMVQAALYWLFNYTWPEPNIGRAQLKQATPDSFTPDWPGHRIWLIEWSQLLRIGDDVWRDNGTSPSHLFVGVAGETPEPLQR